MALTVRPYTDADRAAFASVKSRVYRGGAPVDPSEDVMRPDTYGTVAELAGKIIGIETDIDMSCTVRGSSVRCMGIAAVGVLPEHRRGGIGLQMLTKALSLYRERGCAMASLMPFRAPYYRKAGYATAGTRIALKVPSHRLPSFESDLEVWELPADDHSAVIPCYEEFASRYSGMNLRQPEQWRWQLGGDTRFAIYAAGNPVEAYISTRLKGDFWDEQQVRDFAWSTARGYRAILAFMQGLCINKTWIKWWAPADEPMLWRHDDQGIEAMFDGSMMYRVLDVPAVLGAICGEGSGEFRVEVKDPHLSSNRGPWRVRFDDGRAEVQKGSKADFTLDIGAFTQAALGEPSLEAVARQGSVQVHSEPGFRAALRLLRPHATFCLDFF